MSKNIGSIISGIIGGIIVTVMGGYLLAQLVPETILPVIVEVTGNKPMSEVQYVEVTVEVTRVPDPQPVEVTVEVTREVIKEVTRVVEISVDAQNIINRNVMSSRVIEGNPKDWRIDSAYIPNEMYKDNSSSSTNQEIANGYDNPVEVFNQLENFGRITNYWESYLHDDGCKSLTGLRQISYSTILHRNSEGAISYLEWLKGNPRQRNLIKFEDYPQVGDHSYLILYSDKSGCDKPDDLLTINITFSRLNILGSTNVTWIKDTRDIEEMKKLAGQLAGILDLELIRKSNR